MNWRRKKRKRHTHKLDMCESVHGIDIYFRSHRLIQCDELCGQSVSWLEVGNENLFELTAMRANLMESCVLLKSLIERLHTCWVSVYHINRINMARDWYRCLLSVDFKICEARHSCDLLLNAIRVCVCGSVSRRNNSHESVNVSTMEPSWK